MAQQIAAKDTLAHSSWSADRLRPRMDATCGPKEKRKFVKQSVVLSLLATLLWYFSVCQAGTGLIAWAACSVSGTRCAAATVLNVSELDQLIGRMVREKHLVGLSAGVMQEGKVVLAKGYGVRSLKTSEPVTPETLFAIGSITKQFTCAALLLLAEEGKLSLDDRVAKYDAGLTRAADITLLDLGQHV